MWFRHLHFYNLVPRRRGNVENIRDLSSLTSKRMDERRNIPGHNCMNRFLPRFSGSSCFSVWSEARSRYLRSYPYGPKSLDGKSTTYLPCQHQDNVVNRASRREPNARPAVSGHASRRFPCRWWNKTPSYARLTMVLSLGMRSAIVYPGHCAINYSACTFEKSY
jgi:hypothetical protein